MNKKEFFYNLCILLALLVGAIVACSMSGCKAGQQPKPSIEPCGACVKFYGFKLCGSYPGEDSPDAGIDVNNNDAGQ